MNSSSVYSRETSSSLEKIAARLENIKIFQELTGLNSIPLGKQYWTLCHLVGFVKDSELHQLISYGFLKENQFYGINNDLNIIKENKTFYSNVNWFHGDFLEVIENQFDKGNFNPACIYLDTTWTAGSEKNVLLVRDTMKLCPIRTVLFVNLMGNNPQSGQNFDKEYLVKELPKHFGNKELKKWNSKIPRFLYNATGKTTMITYSFFKQG